MPAELVHRGGAPEGPREAAEARPVVLVRGARLGRAECGSGSLLRERAMDLFR